MSRPGLQTENHRAWQRIEICSSLQLHPSGRRAPGGRWAEGQRWGEGNPTALGSEVLVPAQRSQWFSISLES